jgi:hypothetical protein
MKKYLIALIFLIGCNQVQTTTTIENVDPQVTVIVASMKEVSHDDADKIYKVFGGLALYVEQTTKIDTTFKVNKLVSEMQKDFNYDKGTYKDFSVAVEKFLRENEGSKVKKIVDTVTDFEKERSRADVVKSLKVISQAAYISKIKADTLTVKGK